MIRTILTSTALVALLATGAIAQNNPAPVRDAVGSDLLTQGYDIVDTDGLASRLIGFPVYSGPANDAERYGEINDLVIGTDGQVAAVIIGVGGFLGIGEKNVAVSYGDLQWTVAEDNSERIVLAATREALNAAPAVELVDDAIETGAISSRPATEQPGAVTMDPFDPSRATALDTAALTADDLKGTNVYGPDNQHIGTIGDFVLGEDGTSIDAVIIDFGGFLGIGTKQVAVGYDNLHFYADENNNRSLLLDVTREQMEAAPAFNRDTYAAERGTQRITLGGAA